jgi:DNA-binding MarR family transcriptional regulator
LIGANNITTFNSRQVFRILVRGLNDEMRDKEKTKRKSAGTKPGAVWTFLTNHSHVLICLAGQPDLRLRDVAAKVGITERAVQRIVADLEEAGVLTRSREGRRNQYHVTASRPLRHPVEGHCKVSDLLDMVAGQESPPAQEAGAELGRAKKPAPRPSKTS